MKNKISGLISIIFVIAFSLTAKSQCNVSIIPQGVDTICEGNSVILIADASFPSSTSVIDQEQTNYNGGMSALTGPDRSEFQTFVAGITGTLLQIDMGFFNFISGVGVVNLYVGNGITGTLINTQNVNVNCASGNCTISFPENTMITAGNAYTFQFIPGAGMPYPYGVQVENPGSYISGELFITDPSGTYATGMDMVFATHVGMNDSLEYIWSNGSTDSTIIANTNEIYSVTVTSSLCSAVDSINIFMVSIDASADISGNTITANQNNANYQWLDCNNDFTEITGATNQNYEASTNGSYAVNIAFEGCIITSSCFEITGIGINEIDKAYSFEIYPNPTDGVISIENTSGLIINSQLIIENIFGQIVFEKNLIQKKKTLM